ncbi:hypothetical protein ABH931_006297 [Streptacidiphilus sp. MAP12-33]|uniref:hypothetical protein n=1 Tax=Streptacidiphilus sp. MAP12-33 TaxID=3156266 RepID=UPI0035199145
MLDEVLFADDGLYDACELPAEVMPILRENFRRIQLPDYPMWASTDDSPIRWYSAPDAILRLDGIQNRAWLHARARTPAGLEAIRRLLPGRWVG